MASWDKISDRGDVEDRRGLGPVVVGSLGIGGVALLLAVNLLLGGDATDILNQLQSLPAEQSQTTTQFDGDDEYEVFASTVLGSNNSYWSRIFAAQNSNYEEPKLVLFRESTNSDCGTATSYIGPHYCPVNSTIYLDETFFDELESRFGARGGDVAEAYVIAHEVGHHAQSLLGNLENTSSNEDQIAVELQADCFAGLWASSIRDQNVFEPGEIEEAMDAASAVGDDRIQEKTTGMVTPETWTHGSSEQRVNSFMKGYDSGDFNQCRI